MLRAATLPGAEFVLPLLARRPRARRRLAGVRRAGRTVGLRAGRRPRRRCASGFASLRRRRRRARRSSTRCAGSSTSAASGSAPATGSTWPQGVPTLIVWGERDPIIPVAHGSRAHDAMPGSRLEIFEDAGHFPHRDDPRRFAAVLEDFIDSQRAGRSWTPSTCARMLLERAR